MKQLVERDGFLGCVYCGIELPLEQLGLDHVIPASRGGPDGLSNRVLACRPCDSAKAARSPQEWQPGRVWGIEAVDRPEQADKLRAPGRPIVRLEARARPDISVSQVVWCIDCERHVNVKGHPWAHVLLDV